MIDRNVLFYLVKILCYWYQHREMIIHWGACLSNVFFVTNGVRHGEVLLGDFVSIIRYMQMTIVLLD